MDYTRLGKRIKEERLRLNLTQEKLSEKVGISTAYLGQIERGERCITLLYYAGQADSSGELSGGDSRFSLDGLYCNR